jgi:hypothetical protein
MTEQAATRALPRARRILAELEKLAPIAIDGSGDHAADLDDIPGAPPG